jgi:hypothetical protein
MYAREEADIDDHFKMSQFGILSRGCAIVLDTHYPHHLEPPLGWHQKQRYRGTNTAVLK